MWRLNNEDRGASMVFFAICLVFLIGFAGLAVDVGALYAERTELQKGAEAAALAIAEDCAHETKPCDVPTATATAESYIAANATDLAGALDSLDLDLVAQEVTVIDATERSDGGSIFLPFFAQVIGWEGMTVKAQATARWGTLGSYNTIPITMSNCDIDRDEDGNLPPPDQLITVIFLNPDDPDARCPAHPGFDADDEGFLPAGFGWLLTTDDPPCVVDTVASGDPENPDTWAFEDPGVDPARECLGLGAYMIPIFVGFMRNTEPDCEAINPQPTDCYQIGGYARFTVTGYRFAGETAGVDPGCDPPQTCITGTVSHYTTDGAMGDSFDFGVVVVELIG